MYFACVGSLILLFINERNKSEKEECQNVNLKDYSQVLIQNPNMIVEKVENILLLHWQLLDMKVSFLFF